jgi:hypothetical protein
MHSAANTPAKKTEIFIDLIAFRHYFLLSSGSYVGYPAPVFLENPLMSRIKTVAGALVLGLLFSGMLAGQDKSATDKKKANKKPGKAKKGRLPNNYGKLDLKDDQKEKILTIKADYAPRIKALNDQLKALRNKQKAEYEKVLTSDQRNKLHSLVAAKKKNKKPSSSDKKASSSKDKKKKSRKKKKASKDSAAKDDKTDQ